VLILLNGYFFLCHLEFVIWSFRPKVGVGGSANGPLRRALVDARFAKRGEPASTSEARRVGQQILIKTAGVVGECIQYMC